MNKRLSLFSAVIILFFILALAWFYWTEINGLVVAYEIDKFLETPVMKVIAALFGFGAITALIKLFKNIPGVTEPDVPEITFKENLTTLMDSRVIGKFNDAGNPSYKSKLTKEIEKKKSDNGRISLIGGPGVGKSYLAQEMAYQYATAKKKVFDVVWWIDSESISKRNLGPEVAFNRDLINLATEVFKIDITSKSWLSDLKTNLYNVNFLLIFDNACDVADGTVEKTIKNFREDYFARRNNKKLQKFIITSINSNWDNKIELSPWGFNDFSLYVKTQLRKASLTELIANDESTFRKLYQQLRGLPLATALAIAYMVENRCLLSSYVELLTEDREYHDGQKVTKVFEITYNKLSSEARELLNILAFLAPVEIPLNAALAQKNVSDNGVKLKETEGLKQLEQYCLITPEDNRTYHSIHRLWQEAIREILKEQDQYEQVYANALSFLEKACKDFKGTDYTYFKSILQHIESFASYYVRQTNPVTAEKLTALLRSAANYSFLTGAVAQAMRLNAQVLAIAPNNLKLVHQVGLSNSHNLILRDHCSEAMDLATKAFEYFDKVYEGEDKMIWTEKARQAIGKVKQREGHFVEAKHFFETSKQLIDNHDTEYRLKGGEISNVKKENYSGLLHDLGSVWWEEGLDYPTSITYFDDAIGFKKKINGNHENDFHLNLSKMIKGVALGLSGNYEKQHEIHEEVFRFLSAGDYEQRRKAYTTYYLLNFGWDKIGWQNRSSAEKDTYEKYYTIDEKATEVLEGDVKYAIIKAVVDLRQAVRKGFTIGNQREAKENYLTLTTMLNNKNAERTARFLDDGTVAVSAVLDYAFYLDEVAELKTEAQINQVKAVILFAVEILTIKDENDNSLGRIVYNRNAELDALCGKYNISCLPVVTPS